MTILGAALIYSLSLGADAVTTQRALRNPAVREGNPAMRNSTVMVVSHVAAAGALTYIDSRLQKRSRAGAWVLRGAVLAGGAFVAVHNERMGRKGR